MRKTPVVLMNHRIMDLAALLLLVVLGVSLTKNIWGEFLLSGHSVDYDYFRQLGFSESVFSGILFPRWMADAYYGYGSPQFQLYGPLPYYMCTAFILAGLKTYAAIKLTFVFSLVLSGISMFLLCRDFSSPAFSLLAGLAYMFAPYHLLDMFVRHAMGEHTAFIFIPLSAWGLAGMLRGKTATRLFVGALSLAALILSHNITAMLGTGALVMWWIVLAISSSSKTDILWGGLLLLAGLGISAFFWIPVLAEKELVYAAESLTNGFYSYSNHFVSVRQLIEPRWGFGASRIGDPGDDMSFQVGIPHLLFVLAGCVAVVNIIAGKSPRNPLIIYGVILFLASVYMMLPVGGSVYNLIPLLAYLQFPWRFLVISVFSSSLLVLSIEQWIGTNVVSRIAGAYMIAGVAALLYIFYSQYIIPLSHIYIEDEARYTAVMAKDLPVIEGKINIVQPFNIWDLDYFRSQGSSGTERNEYLPKYVNLIPSRVAEGVIWTGSGEANIEVTESNAVRVSVTITSDRAGVLEFQHFYFPGWGVTVNGKSSKLEIHPEKGTMIVHVAEGVSDVVLNFGYTLLRQISAMISIASLSVLLAYTFFYKKGTSAG